MPNLLRIDDQYLIPGTSAMNGWADCARHIANARNFAEALDNLNNEIGRRVAARNADRNAAETAEDDAEACAAQAEANKAADEAQAACDEAAAESTSLGGLADNLFDRPRDLSIGAGGLAADVRDKRGDLGYALVTKSALELKDEAGNFAQLFACIAADHHEKLAAFTFARERP